MAAQGKNDRNVFDPNKIYNVTEEELRAVQERAAMRAEMKQEFQRKYNNPFRGVGGYIHDPQMQRFLSMRATLWDQFKPAPKNFLFAFSVTVIPVAFLTYLLQTTRDKRERQYRNGEISYRDREYKFVS